VLAFTPPGIGDWSGGLGAPSVEEEGDLVSSGIARKEERSSAERHGENVNFYQLEDTVSTFCAEK